MRQLYFTRDLILLPVFVIFYTFIVIKQLQHWQYKFVDSTVFLLFEVWSLKYGYGYILMLHVSSKYLETVIFEIFIMNVLYGHLYSSFIYDWYNKGQHFTDLNISSVIAELHWGLHSKNISVPKATFVIVCWIH